MIDIGTCYFMCDECSISQQVERRLQLSEKYGDNFQFDHCGCDKVDAEFFMGGYCGDAFSEKPPEKKCGQRNTGSAYRRQMRKRVLLKYRRRHEYGGYYGVAHPNYGYIDGEYTVIGSHIKYPKNSKDKVFYKRVSNKKVRNYKGLLPKGNWYRKLFDYWWTLY